MRKKSPNPDHETPQVKPLVRGPRTLKEKGELAELAFLHKAASLGFGVAKPYGDSESYDFILDSGERFWRVQVKSIYTSSPWVYRTQAHHSNGETYKPEDIDFLVAYIVRRGIWYVIPVNCIADSTALSFYPSGCQKGGGRFECYREAWDLMAPGGDLNPQSPLPMRRPAFPRLRKEFVKLQAHPKPKK